MRVSQPGRSAVLLLAIGAASAPAVALAQAAAMPLAPHRAVYDMSLLSSGGPKQVESVRGRIAFTFSGDACDGYTVEMRQVTEVTASETGSQMSDLRSATFEDADGQSLRFKTETRRGSGAPTVVDGTARKAGDGWTITLAQPQKETLAAPAELLPPTAHMRRVIGAAKAGEKLVTVPVFDGSDDGKKVFDTLTVIGAPVKGDSPDASAQKGALDGLTRWPVTISYYSPGQGERTPLYVMAFDLYENGISGSIKLDYGDFAIRGELKQLDLLKASDCKK